MTNAEEFEKAMECKDKKEAEEFARLAVLRRVDAGVPEEKARALFLDDIGYYAGFYGHAERDKAERLFGAEHPIFGRLRPTTEERLILGFIAESLGRHQARRLSEMLYARAELGANAIS